MSEIKLTIDGVEYEKTEKCCVEDNDVVIRYGRHQVIYKPKDIPKEFDYDVLCWECKDGKDAYKRPSTVKRLSDNETFNINDTTNKGKIYRFEIRNGELLVGIENNATMHYLNHIEKVKPKAPLFTTEDFCEIFAHNPVWILSMQNWCSAKTFVPDNASPFKGQTGNEFKYFSTEEKANEFKLLNKPIEVSYKELSEYCATQHPAYFNTPKVQEFFKSKINGKSNSKDGE